MRSAFVLESSVVHLNHGSFGAVPRPVLEAQQRFRERAEANPMRFNRVEAPSLVAGAREAAGEFLGVGSDSIALVRNVTQATATVFASLVHARRLGPGDAVVHAEQTYETVQSAAQQWCERTGASRCVASYDIGASDDTIVEAYREAFRTAAADGRRVALVIVDDIVSVSAAMQPTQRVCAAATEIGALSYVDAAHVVGQVAAGPQRTGADFWATTWAKWGLAPRGTAALWVSERHREIVDPLTSGRNATSPFPAPFDITGTDDRSNWFCLADAIRFWQDAGGLRVAEDARSLLDEGARIVADALAPVDVALPVRPAPCMRLVPLPQGAAATPTDAARLYERLSTLGVEVQVAGYGRRGYIRLSAAPYNRAGDYERLAEVLPCALREV